MRFKNVTDWMVWSDHGMPTMRANKLIVRVGWFDMFPEDNYSLEEMSLLLNGLPFWMERHLQGLMPFHKMQSMVEVNDGVASIFVFFDMTRGISLVHLEEVLGV